MAKTNGRMSRRRKPEYIEQREKAERERSEREQHADNADLISGLVEQLVRFNEDRKADGPKKAFREYLTIALVSLTVLFTGATYFVFYRQTELARAQIILDQRPWISLDVEISGPLTHDAVGWSGSVRWHIPVTYRLKNYGKTPASTVVFWAHVIPVVLRYMTPQGIQGTDLVKALDAACEFPEGMAALVGMGKIMFPEEQWPPEVFDIAGDEKSFEDAKKSPSNHYTGQFMIAACVAYDSPVVTGQYRTAKAFYLTKKTGGGINLNGEVVNQDNLAASVPMLHGSYAR